MSWFSIVKKDKVYEDYLNDLQSWAKNIRLEQDQLRNMSYQNFLH